MRVHERTEREREKVVIVRWEKEVRFRVYEKRTEKKRHIVYIRLKERERERDDVCEK